MSELIQSSENLESGHKPIESANFDQDFTLTYSEGNISDNMSPIYTAKYII